MDSDILQHLRWYLTTEPIPQGRLEKEFGDSQSAVNLYVSRPPRASSQASPSPPAQNVPAPAPAQPAPPDPVPPAGRKNQSPGLDVLIDYLAEEIEDKQLKERAAMWREMKLRNCDARGTGLLKRRDCEGLEAVDKYVAWIVAALRDFPYLNMPEGKEAGIWIRDDLIAKTFQEHWDFYNNKKLKGFDLDEFYEVLRILVRWLKDVQKELLGEE
eukprot:Skav228243  [mRNA]  locus=scaffold3112:129610:130251:+ [translate_table: standard]